MLRDTVTLTVTVQRAWLKDAEWFARNWHLKMAASKIIRAVLLAARKKDGK